MKKNRLMNGDIVVIRNGSMAVVIRSEKDTYIMFQNGGWESLVDCYDDDLIYEDGEDAIMKVYRGVCAFSEVDDVEPIFEREICWDREIDEDNAYAEQNNDSKCVADEQIHIIAQAFYGNRTGTTINREEVDRFILGCIDNSVDINIPVDRTVIKLLDTDNIVLIYNKYQENRERERLSKEEYILKPLAKVRDMKIYSRCIVCRIDEYGELDSIRSEDYAVWNKFLAE